MVLGEILEDIFAYLSRDSLDHCEIICRKWRNSIGTSKRLLQRRVVSLRCNLNYPDNDPYNLFWMELKSPVGKTIRLEDDPNQQELPAFLVFKNIIIDKMVEYARNEIIDLLEERWMKIFKLTGGRIIVKNIYIIYVDEDNRFSISLKLFQDLIPKYFDAEELTTRISSITYDLLFTQEEWAYFKLADKNKLNTNDGSNTSNIFSIDTFKEFVSGRYMEHLKLNELVLYLDKIDRHVIFSSIVQAFCNSTEPQKFFKYIKTWSIENFDEIVGEFPFVNQNLGLHKYRLQHPKLNWALEATQPPNDYLKFMSFEL